MTTISPLPPPPTEPAGRAGQSTAKAAGQDRPDFGALVDGALARHNDGQPARQPDPQTDRHGHHAGAHPPRAAKDRTGATKSGTATPAVTDPAGTGTPADPTSPAGILPAVPTQTTAATTAPAAATPTAAPVSSSMPVTPAAAPTAQAVLGQQSGAGAAPVGGRATTDMATGAAGATQTGAASTPVPTVTGPPAPGRAAPDTPAPPSGSDVGAVGVVSGSPSGSDIGGRGEAGPGTVAATDRHAGAATDGAVPAPTAATQVLPGVGPATAATPTAPTAPTGSGPSPAVSQVVPAVTRLVSRGDGTNRLVLKLHPADLGEVQVTVTVRGRAVDVTLAAGPAARDALHQGSGQLRWLLDLTGHVTGQLVVRDLPSAPSTGSGPRLDLGTPSHPGSNGGNANDAGAPGGSTGDPQRDGRPARVPMTAATGGAPTTTPTTTPATRRTTAGALDLTI